MPETPHTWTLGPMIGGRDFHGGCLPAAALIDPPWLDAVTEVIEKAPIRTALEAASKGSRNDAWRAVEELLRVLGGPNA